MRRKKNQGTDEFDDDFEDIEQQVASLVNEIRKKHGNGIAFHGKDSALQPEKEVISTGLLSLDLALGIGGIPLGRMVEIFGPETCGKSNLALKIAARALNQKHPVYFIDLEHALDPTFAENTGVNIKSPLFVISQPDYGEQAFDIIEAVLNANQSALIIIDSVAALLPRSELDASFLDTVQPGRQAALMSNALRRIVGQVSKSNCTIIFINQTRSKIGSFYISEDTPGGKALKFYASLRIKVTRLKTIEVKEEKVGHIAKIRIEKNKLATPFGECSPTILYGSGFSSILDCLDLAIKNSIIDRSGSWYTYKDERVGQGLMQSLQFLFENPNTYLSIVSDLLATERMSQIKHSPSTYLDQSIIFGSVNLVKKGLSDLPEIDLSTSIEREVVSES